MLKSDSTTPQDGDSSASRILTRAGEGCEIPRDSRCRDVFANPGNYVVQVQVVENRGTTVTGPLQSRPLERASGLNTAVEAGDPI